MNAAIVVCIGGFPKQVGRELLRQVRALVASAGDVEAARAMASQIHVIAVDAYAQPDHDEFGPGGTVIVPSTPDFIDRQIDALWTDPGDPFFREWWPAEFGKPVRVGDYDHGDGRNRLKSKLGYRLSLTQHGSNLAVVVAQRVAQINNALGPAAHRDETRVPVYIVASLGGGAGSGKALVAAQHLRATLPGACKLIGVFVLPDISEQLVTPNERAFIWANADAALAEIDYFQLPAHLRPVEVAPFLRWPAADGVIVGDEPPFSHAYLFGARNLNGTNLPGSEEYVRLVAECLATEVFSPITDNVMDPHAQFAQAIGDQPIHDGRPWTYASAGIAELVYPVDRIELHLSRRWIAETLAAHVLADGQEQQTARTAGANEADKVLASLGLASLDALLERFTTTAPGCPPLSAMPGLRLAGAFAEADRDQAAALVGQAIERRARWLNQEFGPNLRAHRDATARAARGGDPFSLVEGALTEAVARELGAGTVAGVLRAQGLAAQLRARAAELHDAANTKLHGPRWQVERDHGLARQLAELRDARQQELTRLRAGFGAFSRRGRTAKHDLIHGWWRRTSEAERRVALLQTAADLAAELIAVAERLDKIVRRLTEQIAVIAADARRGAADDLLPHTRGAVLEEDVLAEPSLVDLHFANHLAAAVTLNADALIAAMLRGAGEQRGLLAFFAQSAAATERGLPEDQVERLRRQAAGAALAHGEALFAEAVRQLSVWEAAGVECDLRLREGKIDTALQSALEAGERRTAALLDAGHLDAGHDGHLRQRFIEAKLTVVARRAAPFWSLDPAIRASHDHDVHGRPFTIAVLACDRAAYQGFLAREAMDDFMTGVEQRLQVRRSHRPGQHSVAIYARQGGLPLFYLDAQIRQRLRQAGRHLGHMRQLATDKRFVGVVGGGLTPPEPLGERTRASLAAAAHFGLARFSPGQVVFQLNGAAATSAMTSLSELAASIVDDPVFLNMLDGRVRACVAAMPAAERSKFSETVAASARSLAAGADPADRQWWLATAAVVEGRRFDDR